MMRILYLISARGHGRGGHFHSLNHISIEVSKRHEIKIVSIGPGYSDIIAQNHGFYKHISMTYLTLVPALWKIKRVINEIQPDIIHSFDVVSYNTLRLIISGKKVKLVINKCGGPNHVDFPYAKNLVVFSQENLDWFQQDVRFRDSRIYLIPNRVHMIKLDPAFQPIKRERGTFNFVRICRIGLDYKKSIEDSIRLMEYLQSNGFNQVRLTIIGIIEDQKLYQEIILWAKRRVRCIQFLTDPKYTWQASRMLYLADAVIGSGRGLMEASSLSLPVLTMDVSSQYPVLVTKESFPDAFKTNFSPRNSFSPQTLECNLRNIKRLLTDPNYFNSISGFSKEIFDEYFDIEKASKAYSHVYKSAIFGSHRIVTEIKDMIIGIAYFLKSLPK